MICHDKYLENIGAPKLSIIKTIDKSPASLWIIKMINACVNTIRVI